MSVSATDSSAGSPNNLQGSCKEGYKGLVCADCQKNYVKTGIYCSKCPSHARAVFDICLLLFLNLLVFFIVLR